MAHCPTIMTVGQPKMPQPASSFSRLHCGRRPVPLTVSVWVRWVQCFNLAAGLLRAAAHCSVRPRRVTFRPPETCGLDSGRGRGRGVAIDRWRCSWLVVALGAMERRLTRARRDAFAWVWMRARHLPSTAIGPRGTRQLPGHCSDAQCAL